ncbi:hypothetical protein [Amycolatopsis sp. NPDC057786]|uniref:hypothetical protein n=1 Tax=Amycolatopsis sp. NPDC057786 TaxID=3346250 RepID=UPI00366C058A
MTKIILEQVFDRHWIGDVRSSARNPCAGNVIWHVHVVRCARAYAGLTAGRPAKTKDAAVGFEHHG